MKDHAKKRNYSYGIDCAEMMSQLPRNPQITLSEEWRIQFRQTMSAHKQEVTKRRRQLDRKLANEQLLDMCYNATDDRQAPVQ